MSVAMAPCGLRIVRRRSVRPRYAVKHSHLRASWLDPRLHGDAWIVPGATKRPSSCSIAIPWRANLRDVT